MAGKENTIECTIELKDQATKSLNRFIGGLDATAKSAKNASETLKKIIGPAGDLKKGLEQAAKAQEKLGKKTGDASDAVEKQTGLFGDFRESLKTSLDEAKKFYDSNTVLTKRAGEAFKDFQNSAGKSFTDLFTVVFKNNTKKAEKQWKKFLDEIERAFLSSIARMVGGVIERNLFPPPHQPGAEDRGLGNQGAPLRDLRGRSGGAGDTLRHGGRAFLRAGRQGGRRL